MPLSDRISSYPRHDQKQLQPSDQAQNKEHQQGIESIGIVSYKKSNDSKDNADDEGGENGDNDELGVSQSLDLYIESLRGQEETDEEVDGLVHQEDRQPHATCGGLAPAHHHWDVSILLPPTTIHIRSTITKSTLAAKFCVPSF